MPVRPLIRRVRLVRMAPTLLFALAGVASVAIPRAVQAQADIRTESEGIITISRGSTAIITRPDSITRISVADPAIAEPVVIPPNQVLVNGIQVGSTSVILWGRANVPIMYTVEVRADIASLQRQIDDLFPGSGVTVTSTGTSIVLSGEVRDPQTVRKVTELAGTMGIPIVSNLQAPPPEQILLHVEFAEVTKSAMKELGGDLVRILNPPRLDGAFDELDKVGEDQSFIETLSSGLVTLFVESADGDARLDAIIRLLKSKGDFHSLAEPNLVTREGQLATFLAGGEFPYPTIQGNNSNAITVVWKEFGIRLNFTPTITNSGNVRLLVAPEVSSLDFANGLTVSGFSIPSILARRVSTDVELRPGQTLAIGGLLDNTITEDEDKIPILGDLPIIGFFFKSKASRQSRTELLVLVTPYILDPNNLPAPPTPTGDPDQWDWDRHIRRWIQEREGVERLGDPPAGAQPEAR